MQVHLNYKHIVGFSNDKYQSRDGMDVDSMIKRNGRMDVDNMIKR